MIIDYDDYIDENVDFINGETFEKECGYDENIASEFHDSVLDFLNYIILKSNTLEEDFVSSNCINTHFSKHCIGKKPNRKSTRNRVLYDFTDKSQYSDYEKKISRRVFTTKYLIGSLYNYDTIIKYIRKLFEGDIAIQFCLSCGLNNNGPISLSMVSYSSNVTKNYKGGNTIDICIKNASDMTISLYPIDVMDVQKRFNNTLANYSQYRGKFILY